MFPIKMEELENYVGLFFKKRSITYFHTKTFQCYLPLRVWCTSVCVLFICIISISIICVSQEKPSLLVSKQ